MRYLILGAGPTGLSIANRLKQLGEDSFLVLEKELVAGGLCRSEIVDGTPLDIGGGHFLDVRCPMVNDFLFDFMPKSEWNLFIRDSRIIINSQEINHPFEANLWQLDLDSQIEYLKSIAEAGCNTNKPMPMKFIEWIRWKLGDKIARDYMIPYNQKLFQNDLNELGTYWLEKLPNVSFEDTLRSCLTKRPYGKQPGHERFYYPKQYGYGELWLRMADNIKEHIIYCKRVKEIDFCNKIVRTQDNGQYSADMIITTIPWKEWERLEGLPEKLWNGIQLLKHNSVEVRYYAENLDTTAHWIYYPDCDLPYHRILVRSNFCSNSRGYWTETNGQRTTLVPDSVKNNFHYTNQYAYPLNTIEKTKIMKALLDWSKERGVIGIGRWGEHEHYNSDITVERALLLVDKLLKEG